MRPPHTLFSKYGFLWITAVLFLGSLIGHWCFAWTEYEREQQEHGRAADFSGYFVVTARDTLENWQSEFLQLIWQVAGLAYLLYIGSPKSKDGDERKEEKIDEILKLLDRAKGQQIIETLDARFPKK